MHIYTHIYSTPLQDVILSLRSMLEDVAGFEGVVPILEVCYTTVHVYVCIYTIIMILYALLVYICTALILIFLSIYFLPSQR